MNEYITFGLLSLVVVLLYFLIADVMRRINGRDEYSRGYDNGRQDIEAFGVFEAEFRHDSWNNGDTYDKGYLQAILDYHNEHR